MKRLRVILIAWGLVFLPSRELIPEETKAYNEELLSKQVSIEVAGPGLKSTYGKISCVYYESAELYYKNAAPGNRWSSTDHRFSSSEPFQILIEGSFRVTVKPSSTLRLFIPPTYERTFTPKGGYTLGKRVDYCLQKGKKYFLLIRREAIEYGPPDETGRRGSKTYDFIQISDREFKDDRPQVDPTPTYFGWIYG